MKSATHIIKVLQLIFRETQKHLRRSSIFSLHMIVDSCQNIHKYSISSDFTNIQWKMSLARGIRLLQLSKPPVRHANFTLHGAGTKRWYGSRHEMPFVPVQRMPAFVWICKVHYQKFGPHTNEEVSFDNSRGSSRDRYGLSLGPLSL
jgi:hypothetical protein